MGTSRDLLYPFQLSSRSNADSRGVICGKSSKPISGERGTIVKMSPKQIMSGEVVQYKFCAVGYGRYCQIHEEDQPLNSTAARTQGEILLRPSGNAQGGHKIYTLNTGKVVICQAWTELPTPASVIS